MFSFTLDIYCTSVRPGRGIPHMWLSLRFLLSFYLLKGFFSSFSLLLLRVKGRGCHTLLKPYETNCGLWIWAIQIKFDWLIDWLTFTHKCSCLTMAIQKFSKPLDSTSRHCVVKSQILSENNRKYIKYVRDTLIITFLSFAKSKFNFIILSKTSILSKKIVGFQKNRKQ